MKVTIYDVAKKAKVSIATVSKVLNQSGSISDKTRERVLRVMEELNYRPSAVASALTGKRMNTVGLLIPDLANPFFAEIARAVEDRGHELGYNLIICSTDNDPKKEEQYISLILQKSIDGLILATGSKNSKTIKNLIAEKIPIAIIARDMPTLEVDAVLVDDYVGGYLATSHLLELGHQRIGIITEDLEVISSQERLRGYAKALNENGIEYDFTLLQESNFSVDGGKQAAKELLSQPNPPTAIFACNDLLAIGVLQATREVGYKIPKDLSVVGFDNTIMATLVDPQLTTIAQPIEDIGKQVLDLLIEEINEQKEFKRRVELLPKLIVRQSTAPIKRM